jgi:hypothetical protein
MFHVADRRGGGREVIDAVKPPELGRERLRDIGFDESETWTLLELGEVFRFAGDEIVQNRDVMAFGDKGITKMGTYKSRPAGNQAMFHVD